MPQAPRGPDWLIMNYVLYPCWTTDVKVCCILLFSCNAIIAIYITGVILVVRLNRTRHKVDEASVVTEVGSYKTKIARDPIFLSRSLLVLECPSTNSTMMVAIPSLSEHPLLTAGSSFLIMIVYNGRS